MQTTISTTNRFQVRYFVGNRAEVATPFQVIDIHSDETPRDYGCYGGPAVVSRHGTRGQAQKAADRLNQKGAKSMWVFNTEFCTGEVETTQHATEAQARAAFVEFFREWEETYGENNVHYSSRNTAQFRNPGCEWNYCSYRAA